MNNSIESYARFDNARAMSEKSGFLEDARAIANVAQQMKEEYLPVCTREFNDLQERYKTNKNPYFDKKMKALSHFHQAVTELYELYTESGKYS